MSAGGVALVLMAITIPGEQYFLQVACIICTQLVYCLILPAVSFYVLLYSPPELLGRFNGLLFTIVFFFFMMVLCIAYTFLAEDKTSQQMGQLYLFLNIVAVVATIIWGVRASIVGLPK